MPLSIEQEGLLNELARQLKSIQHLETSDPLIQKTLDNLLPMWAYVDFADIIKAGVVQAGKQWTCERPLENLIKAIMTTPLSKEQKTSLFLKALTETRHPIPEAQRQVIMDLIANNI